MNRACFGLENINFAFSVPAIVRVFTEKVKIIFTVYSLLFRDLNSISFWPVDPFANPQIMQQHM